MRSIRHQCAWFLLVLVALVAGAAPAQAAIALPSGSLVYWNPVGTSTDGDDPTNWTDGPSGNGGTFTISSLTSYILSFHGTGTTRNADCTFNGGTICAGVQSAGGYGGVITIALDNTLTVQGVLNLTVATRLVIETGGLLVVSDVQRAGSTLPNTLSVPVVLQVNGSSTASFSGIASDSTQGLTIAGVISGAEPLMLGTANTSVSSITALSAVNTLSGGVKIAGGHVVISGSLPTTMQVVIDAGAELQVDGSSGPIQFGPPLTRGQGTPGRLSGKKGRTGAITWYQATGGGQSQALPPSGTGKVVALDDQGLPALLSCASLTLATAASELAEVDVRVNSLTNPGTGYSRLASSGAVQIGTKSKLQVDATALYVLAGQSGIATGRIPGIITHPANQRTGVFMPGMVTISNNQGFSGKNAVKGVSAQGVTTNPVFVPDYSSTGVDLVVIDSAALPVASFTTSTSTVFAGQAQATLGVVTLSPAPTTKVIVTYTDDILSQGTFVPGSEFPGFTAGSVQSLTFESGETVKAITTQIGVDSGATFNKTFALTLTDAIGATLGSPSSTTVTIVRGVGQPSMTANTFMAPVTLGTVPLGQPITVVVTGGLPPYIGVGTNMSFFAGPLTVTGGGVPQQTFSAVGTSLAASAFSFTDTNNAVAGNVTFTSQALVATPVTVLSLPLSLAPTTTYVPLCPSTPEGVSNLMTTVAGVTATDIAAYSWNAASQSYAKLPAQPSGGLTKTHGVFVATRVPVTFDFTGAASPMYSEIILRPGWNFVGVPPIDDGSTIITSHPWVNLLLFPSGTGVSAIVGVEREAYIGLGAYFWNGSSYAQVMTLTSGVGYWIKNNSDADLTLVRSPGTTGVARGAQSGGADGVVLYRDAVTANRAAHPSQRTVDRGSPPPPPGGSAAASNGNSCGFGSGIAGLALMVSAAFALLLVRRR